MLIGTNVDLDLTFRRIELSNLTGLARGSYSRQRVMPGERRLRRFQPAGPCIRGLLLRACARWTVRAPRTMTRKAVKWDLPCERDGHDFEPATPLAFCCPDEPSAHPCVEPDCIWLSLPFLLHGTQLPRPVRNAQKEIRTDALAHPLGLNPEVVEHRDAFCGRNQRCPAHNLLVFRAILIGSLFPRRC